MAEYKLAKRSAVCMACQAPFPEGATIVSALYPEGEAFLRRDLCESCFAAPGEVYSFWRARQPKDREERIRLDLNLAGDFLRRLLREEDPVRRATAYMVALLLARKRRVKLLRTVRTPDGELMSVLVPGAEEDEVVDLPAPKLGPEESARLEQEMAALFADARG